MPLRASRRFIRAVSACVAVCMIATIAPSAALPVDPIDRLEHDSIALIYLDNTEFGVGFVVASDANSSYLLTAAHVLGCADTDKVGCRDTVKVRFVGQLAATTGTKALAWKNIADGTDLALVKIDRGNLQPVPILSQTAIDDEFYVIGFSARIIQSSDQFGGAPEVHDGNISRIQSSESQNFLEANVTGYPGFSGGPIVDKSTRAVVGVFSGHLSAADQNEIDYRGVGPAKILQFLVAAQQLTHVPFVQISSEDKAVVTAASDPISLPPAGQNVPLSSPAAPNVQAHPAPASAPPPRPTAAPSVATVSPPTPAPSLATVSPPTRAPSVATARPPTPAPSVATVSPPTPAPSVATARPPTPAQSVATAAPPTPAVRVAAPPAPVGAVVALAAGVSTPNPSTVVASDDFKRELSAANSGDPAAQFYVAAAYERGAGVQPDSAQGLTWLQKAADAKYPAALTSLAAAYANGQGVQTDRGRALELYEQAANLGDARAAMFLGNTYHYGKLGTTPDESQSKAFYAKGTAALSAASARGDGTATWSLGYAYVTGTGVSAADIPKGISLLELGVEQGSPGAANNLGLMYLDGRNVTRDVQKGIALLDTSARLGGPSSAATLAYIYLKAQYGVPRDLAKGFAYLNQAASLGYAPAMWQLGNILVYGVGDIAPRDVALGCSWYERSAALNYLPAQTQYARCLLDTGPPETRDPARGLQLLQAAAQKNWSGAQMYLGEYYRDGQFVPKDVHRAFGLFLSSAQAGQRGGQFDLGQAYEYGQGVLPDRSQAVYWYQLAANRGDARAQQKLAFAASATSGPHWPNEYHRHRKPRESHP